MPTALRRLLARLIAAIAGHTRALEEGRATLQEWYDRMAATLSQYHQAAYLAGSGDKALNQVTRGVVVRNLQAQLQYLDNFRLVIQSSPEWQKGFTARAVSYAGAIKQPYWQGRTKLLPLPAMPGDGTTQCKGNCACSWDIQVIDEEAGDYNCYWRLGAKDHCQTCVSRASSWAPLLIRGGVLE